MVPVLRGVVVVVVPVVVFGLVGVLGEELATNLEAGDFGLDVFVPGLVADLVPDVGRVGMAILDDGAGLAGVVLAELGALRVVVGFLVAVVRVVVALVAAADLTAVVVVVPVRLAVVAPCVLGAVVRLIPPTFVAPAALAVSVVVDLAPAVVPDESLDELVAFKTVDLVTVVLTVLVVVVVVVFFAGPTPAAPVLFPPLPDEASNLSLSCFFFSSISLRFCSAASFFCLSFSFLSSIFFFFSSSCCSFSFLALSSFSLIASADAVDVGPLRPLPAADFEPAAAPAPVLVVFAAPVAPGFLVEPAVVRAVDVPERQGERAREKNRVKEHTSVRH